MANASGTGGAPGRAKFTFGLAAPGTTRAEAGELVQFAAILSAHTGIEFCVDCASSYDELAARMSSGVTDVAWLPPIVFLGLEQRAVATPLVAHHRGGDSKFQAVLITQRSSKIRTVVGIPGARVAWVDRWSASGYVLPRIQLAALGIDPRTAFSEERFFGSHEAVVRAVVGGKVDLGATFANADPFGRIVKGPWSKLEGAELSLRILAPFGAIPGDVTAARTAHGPAVHENIRRGLLSMSNSPEGSRLVRRIFGVDEFRRWITENYEPLRSALMEAAARGLLEAVAGK